VSEFVRTLDATGGSYVCS